MKTRFLQLIAILVKVCCIFNLAIIGYSAANAQLTLNSGANLVTSSNTYIVLNNTGLANSGNISAGNSFFVFTGTAPPASTMLKSATALGNITINKSNGGVLLGSPVSVNNTVQLSGGTVNLNGFDLDLGTTGTLSGEGTASYITGTTGGAVVRTAVLNGPSAVNPGNMGITITSSANLGTTVIRRGHQQQTLSATGNSIYRYFNVTPANNSGLNATIRFNYLDAELAGLSESGLRLFTSADAGSTWQQLGADARDISANYVEKTGIASLARLTLGENSIILPVHLLSFTGKLTAQGTELQWSTALEQNNSYFDVERSDDGIAFIRFATLPSQGNTSASHTYSVTDNKPFSTIQFYRLKQVNSDGSYTYTKVIALSKNDFPNKIVHVFPNPVSHVLYIDFSSSRPLKVMVQVTDIKGQQIISREVQAVTGLNNVMLDVSNLAIGIYHLSCAGINPQPVRFIKID